LYALVELLPSDAVPVGPRDFKPAWRWLLVPPWLRGGMSEGDLLRAALSPLKGVLVGSPEDLLTHCADQGVLWRHERVHAAFAHVPELRHLSDWCDEEEE
jgi:hypothetical protein